MKQTSISITPIIADGVYVTVEAARVCRVKPSRIQRAVRLGEIQAQGRPFRILGSELLKFLRGVSQ